MVLPIVTVSFLFSDIQGSTALWENHPTEMRSALARHDILLRRAIEENNGIVFKTVGDAFCAAFQVAYDAVAAAVQAQLALQAEPWQPAVAPLAVRMGLHTGAAEVRDNDYFGPALNRVARLMSIGHGGQILLSASTQELVRDNLPVGVEITEMGAHRLKDLIRPETVFQLSHPGLPSQFPTLRSLNSPDLPNNLPQQVSSFIGRERELSEIKGRLASSRLVTLLATGGTGKSRLSLQVAADMLEEFPDGVWFVELAALTEPTLIAPTIARLLNVGEAQDVPIADALSNALKSRRLLLILDNCEHLITACAQLAGTLLRNCPNVVLLASSREALNIPGETVYPLRALAVPDPGKRHDVHSLAGYDAVQLFVDRATSVRPDFAITPRNADALAQLCHRLDGIPLALELAAARVRSLPVEEINARLDNRFRLLTGGSRNVLPRQQTLRALIDWSYDLLNEQERCLLARLSVFSGGWTLSAAEAICSGAAIEEFEVFDLLTALSDKSLVVCEADDSRTRYRFLETLREYSGERLGGREEAQTIAERHAGYYASALSEKSHAQDGEDDSSFPWLLTEADNIRSSLEWFRANDRIEAAAATAVGLRSFWTRRGWLREAFNHLEWVAERREALSDLSLRARVLKDAGWFAYLLGDLATAERLTQESVEIASVAGVQETRAHSLGNLALIAQSLNDYGRAEALFVEAIAVVRRLEQDNVLANYLMNLGLLYSIQERHTDAQSLFSEAQLIYERKCDADGILAWLCNQSDLALRLSKWQEAQLLAEQGLEHARKHDHRLGIAYALTNLAKATARQGNHPAVESAVREAVGICTDTNLWDLLPLLLIIRADSYLAQGKMENAALVLAGAVRLRALLNIPAASEELHDLDLVADTIREKQLDDLFSARRAQFLALNREELLAQLAPLI